MLVLLDTGRPLSLREITEEVDGYPPNKEAARQAFERDKRALRDLGVPVRNVPIDAEEQVGYLVDPDEYFLPNLELDEDEARALSFAVAAVQLGGSAGRDALSALGHAAGLRLDAPIAVLPALPALATVHEALRRNAVLGFRYRGRDRLVEPYGLVFRQAAWYLVGRDETADDGAGAMRTFRVDRFESEPALREEGTFEAPSGLDLAAQVNLLAFGSEGGEAPTAVVRVDGRLARQIASLVPTTAGTRWDPDGSAVVSLPVTDTEAFVSWVTGLGDTAVVEAPAALVGATVARLEEMTVPPVSAAALAEARPTREVEERPSETKRQPTAGLVAGERLRRLLAILVYLARVGEADLAETAKRFEMSKDELVHDLELAACCGVPPYTPDQLIELIVDDETVSAHGLGHLAKPRRLTPEEGFALAAAAKALSEVPGAGEEEALRSALSKLEATLGETRVSLDVERPEHLTGLQEAVRRHERVEIEYFSSAALEPTTREVDPYQVVLREGRWYLDGWCHLVQDRRRFQVDRVRRLRLTGTTFAPPTQLDAALTGPDAFIGGPDTVRARVAFPPASRLGVEQFAAAPIEPLPDGRLVTEVLVGDVEGWFGRLLLRLGPGTEVLSPPELRDVAARAARRALGRYVGDGAGLTAER